MSLRTTDRFHCNLAHCGNGRFTLYASSTFEYWCKLLLGNRIGAGYSARTFTRVGYYLVSRTPVSLLPL